MVNLYPSLGMVNLLCWNIRGLNGPNKQKEVKLLCSKENIGLVGLLETKIKRNKIENVARSMFGGWEYITNLESHHNGRIWLSWRPDYYKVIPITSSVQVHVK